MQRCGIRVLVQSAAIVLLAVLDDRPLPAQGQTWTQVVTPSPGNRTTPAMVYDSQRGRTVLFGGYRAGPIGSGGIYLADTWEWDGATWTQMASAPAARYWHAMAYDSLRGRTVLFGGKDAGQNTVGDTWEWDGNIWTQVTSTGPVPRRAHGMAYDSQRGRTVLFGGADYNGLGDTWEWDGRILSS